jgi:hypothetical protein
LPLRAAAGDDVRGRYRDSHDRIAAAPLLLEEESILHSPKAFYGPVGKGHEDRRHHVRHLGAHRSAVAVAVLYAELVSAGS